MILKSIFTFGLLCIITFGSNGQVINGSYEKLATLFSEGKYEKCLYKADDYTYREDYSKDAEPYLYISMCLIELSGSEDPDIMEDYKGAVKQAIKYGGKFASKDKKDELYSDNIAFVNSLKKSQKNTIKEEFNAGKYRKAAVSAKAYNKLNREKDILVNYYVGMNEILSNNLSQGGKNMKEAEAAIQKAIKEGNLKIDKSFKSTLIDAFMKFTAIKIEEGNKAEGKKVIGLAKDIFPNDGFIKVQYNVIMQEDK